MTKMNKMREQLAQEFIKALSENTLPWERGWNVYRNHNVVTSKPYRGVNTFWLSMVADIQGYEDPRWCTFKQAKDKGWHVKKGEKGTKIGLIAEINFYCCRYNLVALVRWRFNS